MGSVLRIGVVDPVGSIDPRTMAEATTILMARQIFETPFQASASGEAIPALFQEKLAEEPGSAGLRFSTRIRTDARFSDGTPVTAEEVVAALAQDPVFSSRASAQFRDGRVVLALFAPNPRFDLFLTMSGMLFREAGGELLGTGPYKLGPPDGEVVRLVRNPHARTPAKIDSVEVRTFPVDRQTGRPTALLAALEKGEVDLAPRLSWRDINRLKSTAVIMKPVNSTCMLYLNNERLSDPRLRLAMARAIDRTQVAEIAFGENSWPSAPPACFPPPWARPMTASPPTSTARAPDGRKRVATRSL